MPKHLPTSVKAFGCSITHPTNLALAKMGHGPCWTITSFARGNKFTVVAIEYFTRWIEAKREQNIICRFGVPRTLTVDNEK